MTLLPILGLLGPFISPMWYPATRAFAIHRSMQVHPLPQPNLTQYGCDIPDFEMDSNLLQLFHTQDGTIFAHYELFDWNFSHDLVSFDRVEDALRIFYRDPGRSAY